MDGLRLLRIKIGVLLNHSSYLYRENKADHDIVSECPICGVLAGVSGMISRSVVSVRQKEKKTFSQLIRLKGISETVQLA